MKFIPRVGLIVLPVFIQCLILNLFCNIDCTNWRFWVIWFCTVITPIMTLIGYTKEVIEVIEKEESKEHEEIKTKK